MKILFHHLNTHNNECHKGVWIWPNKRRGKLYHFKNMKDGFGNIVAVCDIDDVKPGEKIGFAYCGIKDGKPDWSKKEGADRFLDIPLEKYTEGRFDVYTISYATEPKILYSKPRMIEFHYKRHNEDYLGWKLHAYSKGVMGKDFDFKLDEKNPGYAVAKVPVEFFGDNQRKIWYKLHKDNWSEKDVKISRSILLNKFNDSEKIDVFLREKEITKSFQKPNLKRAKINLYYHRYENDYDNCNLMYWLGKSSDCYKIIGNLNNKETVQNYKKISFQIDYDENCKEFGFAFKNPHKEDIQNYRYVKLRDGEIDVYVVQNEFKIGYSQEDLKSLLERRIIKAVWENHGYASRDYNTLHIEFNHPIPRHVINNKMNFNITDENRKSMFIESIECTDQSYKKFKVRLRGNTINPITNKYYISIKSEYEGERINLCNEYPISISRLYNNLDFNNNYNYSSDDLGANYNEKGTYFRLWSPTADSIKTLIYEEGLGGNPKLTVDMKKDANGTWITPVIKEDLKGKFYTYEIEHNGIKEEVVDPYVKSSGINALRGAVIDLKETNPENWEKYKYLKEKIENPIIYEMSIRDFTLGLGSNTDEDKKGKFLGVAQKIEHLKNLGVNCIQLLPISKFDTDENDFSGGKYNWGYDQTGFWFLPEGSYSTSPQIPENRIHELKEMIKVCHMNGIKVILDVVYNHTLDTENSNFNKITPGYYYRHDTNDNYSDGSFCGNEVATERPMVRKLIVDSIKYWAKEYGVDGFRFDVMTIIDKQTMKEIREELDKIREGIYVYGEGYDAPKSTLPEYAQSKRGNITNPELEGIGAFTDPGSAVAIRGWNEYSGLATDGHKVRDSNYATLFYLGQKGEHIEPQARNGETYKAINYVDVHDNMLLIDHLKLPQRNMSKEERMKRYKLAYTMLLNYIGPVVLKSGAEGVTTKHGDNNSYKTEGVNLLNWKRMEKYNDVKEYFQEYINFRKSHPAYVMKRQDVNKNVDVFDLYGGYVKGKIFNNNSNGDPCNRLAIYHNLSTNDLEITLPYELSGWAVLANEKTAGNTRIGNVIKNSRVVIPALSTIVLGDNRSVEKMMNKELTVCRSL